MKLLTEQFVCSWCDNAIDLAGYAAVHVQTLTRGTQLVAPCYGLFSENIKLAWQMETAYSCCGLQGYATMMQVRFVFLCC
jgi:hypothetical protein